MTASDVNWLLSSTAQSSAALVAIIGGLQGARYVSLHAEQQTARRRLEDIERRTDAARLHRDRMQNQLDLYRIDETLDDDRFFMAILRASGQPTADAALDAVNSSGEELPRELLEERVASLAKELVKAVETLRERVPPVQENHPSWDNYRRQQRLEVRHDGAWAWAYSTLIKRSKEEAKKQQREAERRKNPFGAGSFDITDILASTALVSPEVTALGRLERTNAAQLYEGRLIGYRDDARQASERLDDEATSAREHLADAEQPEGFILSLQVLAYLTLVGVIVPTVVMACSITSASPLARVALVAAFFSGVLLLLRYLFVYAAYLSRRRQRQHLPNNALQLIVDGPTALTSVLLLGRFWRAT